MYKSKIKKKKIALIAIFSLLFTSCSITKHNSMVDIESSNNNSAIVDPIITPLLEENNNVSEIIEAPIEDHPHYNSYEPLTNGMEVSTEGINYSNVINQFPIIKTDSISLEFGFDGYIKRIDNNTKYSELIHIKDILLESSILDDGKDSVDWYFIGATKNSKYIYVQYDYWGTEKYSLLVRMDYTAEHAEICISNPYYENELLNSYVVTNNFIFYTYHTFDENNIITSSILVTDLDGSHPKILKAFPANYEISSMIPQDNHLYFFIKDIRSNETSIYSILTSNLELQPVTENCNIHDYLYIYKDYAIVGFTESYLVYYKFHNNTPNYLLIDKSQGVEFGNILINDYGCYVPVYSWEETSPTKILPLNLDNNSVGDYVLFSYTYSHIVGIDNIAIYVEEDNSYSSYDLRTKAQK